MSLILPPIRNADRDFLPKSWDQQNFFERCERVLNVANPYIQIYGSSYAPCLSMVPTLFLNGRRLYSDYQKGQSFLQICQTGASFAAFSLILSKFSSVAIALTSIQDIIHDYSQYNCLDHAVSILQNAFFLISLCNPSLRFLSLGMQSLSHLSKMEKEYQRGRWLEFLGHFGLFWIQLDRSMKEHSKSHPRCLESEETPSCHTIRDQIACKLLYLSGQMRSLLEFTGWGGGFLGYFGPEDIAGSVAMRCRSKILPGEYDFKDSYWKEVSYRVALCVVSTLLLPVAYPLAAAGTVIRALGFIIQQDGFTLIQSQKDIQSYNNSDKDNYLPTFGWFNGCFIFSGLSRSHGGVADPSLRFQEIVNQIETSGFPTVLGMTEFYGVSDAYTMHQMLKEKGYHFAMIDVAGDLFGSIIGAPSGIAVFSKVPFMNPSVKGFEDTFILQRKACAVADFSFSGIAEKVRVLVTHLIHSKDDDRVNQEESNARKSELNQCLETNPDVIMGDLNISHQSKEADYNYLQANARESRGEDGKSFFTYDNQHAIAVYNPNEQSFHGVLDYIRIMKDSLSEYFMNVTAKFLESEKVGPLSDHAYLFGELKK